MYACLPAIHTALRLMSCAPCRRVEARSLTPTARPRIGCATDGAATRTCGASQAARRRPSRARCHCATRGNGNASDKDNVIRKNLSQVGSSFGSLSTQGEGPSGPREAHPGVKGPNIPPRFSGVHHGKTRPPRWHQLGRSDGRLVEDAGRNPRRRRVDSRRLGIRPRHGLGSPRRMDERRFGPA